MRNRAVSEMMSSRCTVVKLSGARATPLPVSPPSFVIVFSISAGSCTSDDRLYLVLRRGLHERAGKKCARIRYGIRIVHQGHAGELRHDLLQHRNIFPCDACVQDGEPSDVAARTRHASDESAADRIGN